MGKEFLAADFSLTRCYAARCERGWNGLTRIVLPFWMGRRHIGAMRLVATRMVPDCGLPQVMIVKLYRKIRSPVKSVLALSRTPVKDVLP